MTVMPGPMANSTPWLIRKLRPALLAAFLATWLCVGAVLLSVCVFFVVQEISDTRPVYERH